MKQRPLPIRLLRRLSLWMCILAVLASIALTWPVYREVVFENVPTPGFLLNGSFEGRWRERPREFGETYMAPHPKHLELQITEDVHLATWRTHPDSLHLIPGVFARGFFRSDGIESPCEFTIENGEFLIRTRGPSGGGDVRMWMYALESRFTPTVWRKRSSDELDLTFPPDRTPVRFVRED
jgi:hypothetical protein